MTPTNPSNTPNLCPECGAALVGHARRCWLCGWNEGGQTAKGETRVRQPAVNPYASPAPPTDAHLNRTFSLSTMFLWTTLVAVVMGVATIAPGLAIALAVISFPAAMRTIGTVARRKRRRGESLSVPEKIEAFLASCGVVLAILAGAGIAFMAICLPVGFATANSWFERGPPYLAIIAGVLAAGTIAFLLGRRFWPQED
jgi:hypothetical protein